MCWWTIVILCVGPCLINSGRSKYNLTHRFVDYSFEVSSVFLEPDLTTFGQKCGAGENMHRHASILIGSDWEP